jgi:carboxymethylenebutenolidase
MSETIKVGEVSAYLSKPDGLIKGALILIHEVWGLNDHTKNVADRFSAEGYIVVAPNFMEGTPIESIVTDDLQKDLFNPEKRTEVQPKIRELTTPLRSPKFGEATTKNLQAYFNYLYELPEANKNVSIVGFCFGGTYSFNLAANESRLKRAVPFYGHADSILDKLNQIKCPILAFYGEKDEALMSNLDELKKKMSDAGVDFNAVVYPNCGHAFFNDTNPYAYNQEAAEDAWKKTLNFLA